jgi:hypothetical protein
VGKGHMDYDAMTQDALRSVVREALMRAEQTGLPGEHHYYIVFCTDYPGVMISSRLRERYPEEMTVVLQHQFWGLSVTEDAFDVELSFDQKIEHLHIPFKSIKGFLDPSVEFGLQFTVDGKDRSLISLTHTEDQSNIEASIGGHDTSVPLSGQADRTDGSIAGSATGDVVRLDAFRKK